MDSKAEHDSSSSEDDVCMEAIKEAADQDLLKNLLLQAEGQKNNTVVNSTSDANGLNEDQYLTHGLTQSCRDFIAKKLVEKLDVDIVLEDKETESHGERTVSKKPSGIKLFNSSNTILTEVIDDDDEPKKRYKINTSPKFDEKKNLLRCKEVALDSQTILFQNDLKFWVSRKHSQEFKYKKSKNGVLLQVV